LHYQRLFNVSRFWADKKYCTWGVGCLSKNCLFLVNQIEAAEGVMSIDYLGQTFKGDLLQSGKIKSQETALVFNNPSAWAIYCKQIVNPAKKSGCGKF
jgi:hypothetical protein